METGWLRTKDGFQKAEIIEDTPSFRRVKVDGQELTIPGEVLPNERFFPAFYYGAAQPDVWEFEGRSLPMAKLSDFSDPKQAKSFVPEIEPYHFPVRETVQILDGIISGDHILLCGPPGVGKTSLPTQIAARISQPIVRINFNAQVSPADILGCLGIGATGTIWHDGLIIRAMDQGLWLILDELDFCPSELSSTLYSILERVSRCTLKEDPSGRVVTGERLAPYREKRRTGFRIFATGNSFGTDSGAYHGTQQQNAALLNRFTGHGRVVQIKGMSIKDEREMLKARCPWLPEKLVRRATKFAAKVRQSDEKNAAVLPTFSSRELLNFCIKAVQCKDTLQAASLTFLPLITDESTRGAVKDALHAIVGRRVVVGPSNGKPSHLQGRAKAEPTDPAKVEAQLVAVLDAREKGLSWEACETAVGLPNRNGMSAWELVANAPAKLSAKYGERIQRARKKIAKGRK